MCPGQVQRQPPRAHVFDPMQDKIAYLGLNTEQTIKKTIVREAAQRNHEWTHIALNSEDWQNLCDSLESRGNKPVEKSFLNKPFITIQMATAVGMVNIMPDKWVPKGQIALLQAKGMTTFDEWMKETYKPVWGDYSASIEIPAKVIEEWTIQTTDGEPRHAVTLEPTPEEIDALTRIS